MHVANKLMMINKFDSAWEHLMNVWVDVVYHSLQINPLTNDDLLRYGKHFKETYKIVFSLKDFNCLKKMV